MRCPIEFGDSFTENIGALTRYEAQIAEVIRGLAADAYYRPSEEDYNTQYDMRHDFYVCQHICGWGGYRLEWYFVYLKNTGAMIVKVKIEIQPPPEDGSDDSIVVLLPQPPDAGDGAHFDI